MILAAAAAVAAAVLGIWLAVSSPPPQEVVVEVILPPPSTPEPAVPTPPQDAPRSGADPGVARPGAGNAVTAAPIAADAFARVPPAPQAAPLPPAPDAALVEASPDGPLPRRGSDGRLPWQVYARPFSAGDDRAPISLIVTGLGPSSIVTREIIRRLPADVTLAFEPSAADVADQAGEARAAGHEIMLSLPVQGDAFPFLDRGPGALAEDAAAAENRARLQRLLARLSGYVGALANVGAERVAGADAETSAPLNFAAEALAERGLLLVTPLLPDTIDVRSVPRLGVDAAIGPDADASAARAQLTELEARAAERGYAVAIIEPTPAAAEALTAWAGSLAGKPVVLAPVSAAAKAAQSRAR